MPWDVSFPPLAPAVFLSRPNRFLVLARAGGRRVRAASRDPGRLRELFRPGASLLLEPAASPRRRTSHTVVLVRAGVRWVSAVPALANGLFAAGLARGLPGLRGARLLGREVRAGKSRIDFRIRHRGRSVLVEVKSATLVEAGMALFPDAPTVRGTRHLRELTARARSGEAAAVVFVVQRDDARALAPHARNDPAFALALREAAAAGVRLLAYACRVTPRGARLLGRIPLRLDGPSPG